MKALKIIAAIALVFFLNNSLAAQAESPKSTGAFGGPSFMNTSLADEWTFEVGGLGGVFITEQFYVGGAGFALTQTTENDYEYDMAYGGLLFGYHWGQPEKIALNIYALTGYGSISEEGEDLAKQDDDFWVVRPALEVEFPILKWLHIGVGGGYRWVAGANTSTLSNADLSAPFSSLTLRFGNWGD